MEGDTHSMCQKKGKIFFFFFFTKSIQKTIKVEVACLEAFIITTSKHACFGKNNCDGTLLS